MITDALFHVQDEQFRCQFGEVFAQKCLCNTQQDDFKNMDNLKNPLVALINLDSQSHFKSALVRDLMKLICERIDMTKEELLHDTFYDPRKLTLTYMSLFHESLTTLPIHRKIIHQLSRIWEEWEREGFLVSQIDIWGTLDDNRKEIIVQIWDLIQKHLKKTIKFQDLIGKANAKVEDIKKTIENVTLCIRNFCQNAADNDDYLAHLQKLQQQFDQSTTNSAHISSEIEPLKSFADKIAALSSSGVWQEYLKDKLKTQSKIVFVFGYYLLILHFR